ncbi:hypothetical protein JTE90_012480 [Oedothorax gibbosus]|uniref:Uncharacterized protein n=1 Tax=Oedothorax gibbosus TaxID=931172 RepID=A0AAV6UC39_9ARAC|nr:hypothetical protein JTE90_012480 [Oedothorax gibbosus]
MSGHPTRKREKNNYRAVQKESRNNRTSPIVNFLLSVRKCSISSNYLGGIPCNHLKFWVKENESCNRSFSSRG